MNQIMNQTNMSDREFKKDDWVVITKSSRNWNSAMDKFVGKCVQITYIAYFESSCDISFKNGGDWVWRSSHHHFRKAEIHEIPRKFRPLQELFLI